MPQEGIPRGFLPTEVTSTQLVLCKATKSVRNTYEIRLAAYLATKKGLQYVVRVPPGTKLHRDASDLVSRVKGIVEFGVCGNYSVFIGYEQHDGREGDGWVLGDKKAYEAFASSLESPALRSMLAIGSELSGRELDHLLGALRKESIVTTNIDGENVGTALMQLAERAKESNGRLYVQ